MFKNSKYLNYIQIKKNENIGDIVKYRIMLTQVVYIILYNFYYITNYLPKYLMNFIDFKYNIV
jgi:hypothetical protein